MLHNTDSIKRPLAYEQDISCVSHPTKITPTATMESHSIPILTTSGINKFLADDMVNSSGTQSPSKTDSAFALCSHPIILYTSPTTCDKAGPLSNDGGVCTSSINVADESIARWIFLDDVCGSFHSWATYGASGSIVWDFIHIFTSASSRQLFDLLYPNALCRILTDDLTTSLLAYIGDGPIQGFDAMFVPYISGAVTEWLSSIVVLINALAIRCDRFHLGTIWINKEFYPSCIISC